MKFIENLANLIKVKTLVTLAVMGVFTALAINGTITANYLFKNKKEYASYFTKNETKIQKEIDKYIEAYNGIE